MKKEHSIMVSNEFWTAMQHHFRMTNPAPRLREYLYQYWSNLDHEEKRKRMDDDYYNDNEDNNQQQNSPSPQKRQEKKKDYGKIMWANFDSRCNFDGCRKMIKEGDRVVYKRNKDTGEGIVVHYYHVYDEEN